MRKLFKLISKNHGIVIIIFTILGFTTPKLFLWVTQKFLGQPVINLLLGIIMFGMGTTLSIDDFKIVFKRPVDIIKAGVFQFSIMPLVAFLLSKLFGLNDALTLGVILVGTCPGGTASNVITYLAGGDVALSVAMTTFSTILAPILTPIVTYIFINQSIKFSPIGMFGSILQIVIVPITLGILVKYLLKDKARTIEEFMPGFSSLAISSTVAGIIAVNADSILSSIGIILLVVIAHNLLGITIGFYAGKLTGMNRRHSITLAIEVGLQNSGLATSLATTHFPTMPLATIPGALFSAWQNIAGSIFASYMKAHESKQELSK